jgi:hypothetical protein
VVDRGTNLGCGWFVTIGHFDGSSPRRMDKVRPVTQRRQRPQLRLGMRQDASHWRYQRCRFDSSHQPTALLPAPAPAASAVLLEVVVTGDPVLAGISDPQQGPANVEEQGEALFDDLLVVEEVQQRGQVR